MPQIGEFTRSKSGFAGHIRTLTLDLDVTLVPIDPGEVENAPDHRLFHGDGDLAREIGAAWTRSGEKAGEYLSLLIEDPMLAQPPTPPARLIVPMLERFIATDRGSRPDLA